MIQHQTDLHIPIWDGTDLNTLLELRRVGDTRWRSVCAEPNSNDRIFGGQLLGQTLFAAAQGVDPDRMATTMQFMFLQGADSRQAVEYEVTPLQNGKRFTSLHVRGSQGDRIVCDAQVSFAVATQSPAHEAIAEPASDPESSIPQSDVPASWLSAISTAVGHTMIARPAFEFRLPDPPDGLHLAPLEPRLKLWQRLKSPLPNTPHLQAAAFAYMSDYWLNYPAVGGHIRGLPQGERLYQASLNHALWLHRAVRADDWLLFDIKSPAAGSGRGFVIARVHDRAGHLVASCTQECVLLPRTA